MARTAVGVYRLWRDGGYVVGAVLAGVAADLLGMHWAIALVGALTALSGGVVAAVMYETLPEGVVRPAAPDDERDR